MELRQLRHFVRVAELGSMTRAALELNVVQSALSQQISRLESELSTRLLQRTSRGVVPTEAGLAFLREARLTLRHAEQAVRAAQESRLSGTASVGLAPSTASMIGVPLLRAMAATYPDIRLHIVEGMSGHIAAMLNARELDLAVLFRGDAAHRWSTLPILEERLFLMRARRAVKPGSPEQVRVAELQGQPLILPTGHHGLRSTLDTMFAHAGVRPVPVAEIDSLHILMDAVAAGIGCTVQPWSALGRYADAAKRFHVAEIVDAQATRTNTLCSLSDDELSPVALATRVVLANTMRELVAGGRWGGVTLIGP